MNEFLNELTRNLGSPLSNLILQILAILIVARVCGILVRRLGQPQVMGEILAGIFLGHCAVDLGGLGGIDGVPRGDLRVGNGCRAEQAKPQPNQGSFHAAKTSGSHLKRT